MLDFRIGLFFGTVVTEQQGLFKDLVNAKGLAKLQKYPKIMCSTMIQTEELDFFFSPLYSANSVG